MLNVHPGTDRGVSRADWLQSHHSFSFAGWHDPKRMGFRALRVLNEDRVAPGAGFGPHPHRDMEILTVVIQGALEHRDSSGAQATLRAGDVQRMSAGRGVVHSEWNASDDESLEFLQIWLHPAKKGLDSSHEEGRGLFPLRDDTPSGLTAIANPNGANGALKIHQDVSVHAGRADRLTPLEYGLRPGRGAWVQVVRGRLLVQGIALNAGDGLAIEDEEHLVLIGEPSADFLLFDLA